MAANIDYAIKQNELQRSVNDSWYCKQGTCNVIWLQLSLINSLAAIMDKTASDTVSATLWYGVSTKRHHILALRPRLAEC